MAKKKSVKDVKEQAVYAALALAAKDGWEHVSMAAVAAKCRVSLATLHDHFEDRFDIIAAYGRMVDRKVLEGAAAPDEDLPHRDRVFELLMARFDVLNEQRDGVKAVLKSFCLDPKQTIICAPYMCRSMGWMLEAANIETGGIKGVLRIAGLTALYLKTLYAWAEDDSPDMAKTMAALDKNLGMAESLTGKIGI